MSYVINLLLFSVYHVYIVITVAVNIHVKLNINKLIINSVDHLNQPYTLIAIRQQWLPPGVSNCKVFIFKSEKTH